MCRLCNLFAIICIGLCVSCDSFNGNKRSHSSSDSEEDDGEKEEVVYREKVNNGPDEGDYPTMDSRKPDEMYIQNDLVGRQLSEGLAECYHPDDWIYTIEDGDISEFYIENIIEDTQSSYDIIVSMLISTNGHSYNTRAQIRYEYDERGWVMVKLMSLGMVLVSDYRYEDCIRYSFVDDGWGGVNCLELKNECNTKLAVGGHYYTVFNEWHLFSVVIDPLSSKRVGGTFGGGSVTDYEIDFVVCVLD